MELALEEARAAAARGEVPVGAVVTDAEGRVLARAGNRTEELADAPAKLLEFMEMLDLAFGGETFRYEGRHFRMPETHIAPRPVGALPPRRGPRPCAAPAWGPDG